MDKKQQFLPLKILFIISCMAFFALIFLPIKTGLVAYAAFVSVIAFFIIRSRLSTEQLRQMLSKPIYLVIGFVFCVLIGIERRSLLLLVVNHKLQLLSDMLKVSINFSVNCIVIPCVIVATLIVSYVIWYFVTAGQERFQSYRSLVGEKKRQISFKIAFIVLTVIFALGMAAIIRANYNYIDDMGRVAEGYQKWGFFSRFLSNTLSVLIHDGLPLMDASPLPQLIAVVMMAFSGLLILTTVFERRSFSFWELTAVIPLGLSPYFLECLSYKFDAPYIALSVLFAVIPLLFQKEKSLSYILITAICMTGVCTTYQAALGIFPILVILICLRMWNEKTDWKSIWLFVLYSVIGYGLGIVCFRFLLMMPMEGYYVSNTLPPLTELPLHFIQNLLQYYTLIKTDFKWLWLVLIAAMLIGFICVSVLRSKKNKGIACLMACLAALLMGMLCFGMYPALQKTLFYPRAMYGFGALLTIFALTVTEQSTDVEGLLIKNGYLIFKVAVVLLGWFFVVFAFTYGNALYAQKEYTAFRINLVIEDLNDFDMITSAKKPVTLHVAGNIGQAPILRDKHEGYNILNRLIPMSTFGDVWDWSQYGFENYYDLKNVVYDKSLSIDPQQYPVIEDKMYHTIRGKDGYVLVELK